MIFNNPFTKDDWKECRKRTYFEIGLDALLYDAQQNVRVSIQSLYYLYVDTQLNDIKPLPKLINHWVLLNLSQFFKGEIEATDLVSQSKNNTKSNKNNRFNPFLHNSRINLPVIDLLYESYGMTKREILEIKSKAGIKEMKEIPGQFTKPQFGDVGVESLQKDRTTLKKREKRLKRVEQLLSLYYQSDTTEKEQIIFTHLNKLYQNSLREQNVTSAQYLI